MGVLKQKFSSLAPGKVATLLLEEVKESLAEAGLEESQILKLCTKVAFMAKKEMGGEYTVMGGYSAEEQLLGAARKLLYKLDESRELASLLEEEEAPPVSESDMEDAYNAADSLQFTGSPKQVDWARSIATKSSEDIARAWKVKSFDLPTSASWWIGNQNNIYEALISLSTN